MSVPGCLELFCALAQIASPSGEERRVADLAAEYLHGLGLTVDEDDAGETIGSTAGNLYCRLPGTVDGTALFLCSHLDTVQPTAPIEPVVEDGFVRNAAGTILGADNKAAVAVMLEAVRRIVDEGRPHAGVELVLTPKEEVGLRGAGAFDLSRLEAAIGFVYDQAGPIGEVILGAPNAHQLEARFRGRAAHAGMAPEDGRSAIQAAARAVADLRLGRIDDETTANVGTIEGGVARNIVPEWCTITAEARSHDAQKLTDLVREMVDTFTFAGSVSDCSVETTVSRQYHGYRFEEGDPAVRLAAAALRRAGHTPSFGLSGGAADANVFNAAGLQCVNLSNGMLDIHTPDERIAVDDLERMVDVTLALVDEACATPPHDQPQR